MRRASGGIGNAFTGDFGRHRTWRSAHFLIDGYWVGHTNAWEIPGTEDLKPYITAKDKGKKWLFGTIGIAVISAALAAIMMLFMKI